MALGPDSDTPDWRHIVADPEKVVKEVDDGTGAAMVAIGVAAHKTDYRYGDAIVVVPKELHELLCFFVEKIRPALLKAGG
ncbi:hypothetical protein FJT64_013159 [Amphibalanus amphitrite]|uniref:Uncharacterized protein n=1 Tax=Amphibalanus amphitrite TaxID=1232801 RepID=A0A6A4VGB2_AMPAM|nr:hypothetical protein FJT64_013159 [Amphibalanus amphitrite]